MAFRSFQHFVEELERAGELLRINEPVDTELVIAEWANREMKSPGGGKALLFAKPTIDGKTSTFPVAINTMGSRKRIAMALGVNDVADLAQEIQLILKAKPPTDLREGFALLKQGIHLLHARPKSVSRRRVSGSGANIRSTPNTEQCRSDSDRTPNIEWLHTSRPTHSQMLAKGRRAFHYLSQRAHARPGNRRAQCRDVSDAGL